MSEVIIPLAAQTNAIVICSAVKTFCALTSSFTRALALASAKWTKGVPFTVLSMSDCVPVFYLNPNASSVWREVTEKRP